MLQWLPYLLEHLNTFINKFHSNSVALGPRVLMSCPVELSPAEIETWFINLWNHFVIPYLMGTIMAGIEVCVYVCVCVCVCVGGRLCVGNTTSTWRVKKCGTYNLLDRITPHNITPSHYHPLTISSLHNVIPSHCHPLTISPFSPFTDLHCRPSTGVD